MELLEQKINEYISSLKIPDEITPKQIERLVTDSGEITAGVFLKRLREMKISGSDFLELLGNSRISNMEFRRIEENPHLKYEELLRILDNSSLTSEDYCMIISVAAQKIELENQRRQREEDTLRRMKEELSAVHAEDKAGTEQAPVDDAQTAQNEETTQAQPEVKSEAEPIDAVSERELAVQRLLEIAKSRSDIALEEEIAAENVKIEEDYTESNEISSDFDEENEPQPDADESEKQSPESTAEFEIPAKPDSEFEEDDGELDDGDDIGSTAEDIAAVLGELVQADEDEPDEPVSKRSRGYIIAAFAFAFVLFCGAGTLKALQYYEIIPKLIYEIPEVIKQRIVDFTSLLDEAKNADGKISYMLPDCFVKPEASREAAPQSLSFSDLVLTVSNGRVCGAKSSDGKLGDSFTIETGCADVRICIVSDKLAIIASGGGKVTVRIYERSGIEKGEFVEEFILSGVLVDYYTDGKTIYTVTKDSFALGEALSDKLTSFLPSFTAGEKLSVVPFDRIVLPKTVNKLCYYTVYAVGADGKITERSVLTGENSGCAVSKNGLVTAVTTCLNDKYTSEVTHVSFDDKLTYTKKEADGAINPKLLTATETGYAVIGAVFSEERTDNTVRIYSGAFDSESAIVGIAEGKRIARVEAGGGILSLYSDDEQPLRYSLRLSDMTATDEAPNPDTVHLFGEYSAYAKVEANENGDRTGISLFIVNESHAQAEKITASAGDWNAYLSSAATENVSQLAVYSDGKTALIGLPMTYFDGICQVSEYRFYSFDGAKLTEKGSICLYDKEYRSISCVIAGEKPCIYTMWDNRIITADIDKIKIISDIVIDL